MDVLGEDDDGKGRWAGRLIAAAVGVFALTQVVATVQDRREQRDADRRERSVVLLSTRSVSFGEEGSPSLRQMVLASDVFNDGPHTVSVGDPRLVSPGISTRPGPAPVPVSTGQDMHLEIVAVLSCPEAVRGVANARFVVTAVPALGGARDVTVRSGADLPIAGVVESVCRQADRF